MSEFDPAFEYLMIREGGLSENANDKGGITNFGISFRFLKSLSEDDLKKYGLNKENLDEEIIKNLSREDAKKIYKQEFWQNTSLQKIESQNVANYLFDMAVNIGIAPAIKCAQRACWAVMKSRSLVDDGILGEKTLECIKRCTVFILPALRAERAGYYRIIVSSNPDQKEFINGWLNRTYE